MIIKGQNQLIKQATSKQYLSCTPENTTFSNTVNALVKKMIAFYLSPAETPYLLLFSFSTDDILRCFEKHKKWIMTLGHIINAIIAL